MEIFMLWQFFLALSRHLVTFPSVEQDHSYPLSSRFPIVDLLVKALGIENKDLLVSWPPFSLPGFQFYEALQTVDFSHNRIHSLGPATFSNQVQLGWPPLSPGFAKLETFIKSDKAWLATFLSNRTRCVGQQGTGGLAYQVRGGQATFTNHVKVDWPPLLTSYRGSGHLY